MHIISRLVLVDTYIVTVPIPEIVQEDSISKKFFSFIKSKKYDNAGINPLRCDGNLHGDPKPKYLILLNH